MYSVTRRLLLSATVALLVFFGAAILGLDVLFRNLADRAQRELLDSEIVALIADAEPNTAGAIAGARTSPESRMQTPGSGLYGEIRIRGGKSLWRSASMTGLGLSFASELAPGRRSFGFERGPTGQRLVVESRGISWDTLAGPPQQLVVTVALSTESYDTQLALYRGQLLGGSVALAVALIALLWILQRWALSPIRRLEVEILEIENGKRVALSGGWPRELRGVTDNLNELLQIERERIERYRNTLGNLAHSLKTPLAVLRAALVGNAAVPAATVAAQTTRMTEIVDHQLRRATRGGPLPGQMPIAVGSIVDDLRSALLRVYASKDLVIENALGASVHFTGDRDDLFEALGNLLDNSCKWCRSRVTVSAQPTTDANGRKQLQLCIDDDGPGIPEEWRERVQQRGVRADEHQPGQGLGLAMVLEMADAYGGRLTLLSAPGGGARVELTLPGGV